jgi:hypothetical protein
MAKADEVPWVPFDFVKWLAACDGMPGHVELVYWRLTCLAYKAGDGVVKGARSRLAYRCKVTPEQYDDAIEQLHDDGKVIVHDDGVHLPNVIERLRDARDKMQAARERTANARKIAQIRRERDCSTDEAREIFRQMQEGEADAGNPALKTPEPEPEPEQPPPKPWQISAEDAAETWNAVTGGLGLPQVEKITDSRLKHLRARLKDHDGFQGLSGADLWRYACNQIKFSRFLLGKKPGLDWRANFDFAVRPDRFAKLIEGGYTDAVETEPQSGGGQLQDMLRRMGR